LVRVSDLSADFRHNDGLLLGAIVMLLHFRRVLLAMAIASAWISPGRAEPSDHDAIRGAVKRGEMLPLAELIGIVRAKLPGQITGVEAERVHGRWVYEFHIVDDGGHLFAVHVDPRSGDISPDRDD
jgi:uncharacterized membrane protein YkoI